MKNDIEKIDSDNNNEIIPEPQTVPETPSPLFLDKNGENLKTINELMPISNKPTTITFSKSNEEKQNENKQNVWGATFLFANTSLGLTIFTFAIRAKQFGLFWFLVACILASIINIWTLIRLVQAVEGMKERDYSVIVRKILGKKWEIVLNTFLILYVLLFLMTYTTLIYMLIGRFIRSICYKGQYETFDDFKKDKWDKAYYKWPIIFGYCIVLFSISLFRNMEKLNFAGYIGFGAVLYTSVVVVIQCKKYYNWYYNNERIEGDKSTYPNYWDFGKAFTKDLNFFKGMASLFAAYTNHSNCFPIYSSFDGVKDGKKKMIHSIYLSNIIVGLLHCAVIICAFLTEPLEPEDLIIFRINRFGGYDIVMNIAILSSAVCLFFSTPLYFVGLRMVIINTFFGGVLTTKLNLFVTGACFAFSAIVSCVYDKILNYITYVGGFTSIIFAYIYPIILYIVTNKKGFTYWKNMLELILAIVLCIIGFIAGILTIIDDVK